MDAGRQIRLLPRYKHGQDPALHRIARLIRTSARDPIARGLPCRFLRHFGESSEARRVFRLLLVLTLQPAYSIPIRSEDWKSRDAQRAFHRPSAGKSGASRLRLLRRSTHTWMVPQTNTTRGKEPLRPLDPWGTRVGSCGRLEPCHPVLPSRWIRGLRAKHSREYWLWRRVLEPEHTRLRRRRPQRR